MGKESRLRKEYQEGETRQSYSNGDRKLYDRDARPAGTDEYVWHLALFFEQRIQEFGVTAQQIRPVLYTELYDKIFSDRDLTRLLDAGTLLNVKGEGGRPLVTSGTKVHSREDIVKNVDLLLFIETMIDHYFSSYYSNQLPSINSFCSSFTSIKEELITTEYYKLLKTTGTKVPVLPVEPQPDRTEEKVREVLDITVRTVYSEKDMREAFNSWEGN